MNQKMLLVRHPAPTGTFGFLYFEGDPVGSPSFKTVERNWQNNEPFVSCIPTGVYKVRRTVSPKHGETFYLENMDLGVSLRGDTKRTHILFHIANFPEELAGCIGIGRDILATEDGHCVSESTKSFKAFKERLKDIDETIICITDGEPLNV